jgi:hypothetical protein
MKILITLSLLASLSALGQRGDIVKNPKRNPIVRGGKAYNSTYSNPSPTAKNIETKADCIANGGPWSQDASGKQFCKVNGEWLEMPICDL